MERVLEFSYLLLCVLGTLSIINFSVRLIPIPDILMMVFLLLFALVFFLRAVIGKKKRNKTNDA